MGAVFNFSFLIVSRTPLLLLISRCVALLYNWNSIKQLAGIIINFNLKVNRQASYNLSLITQSTFEILH